MLLRYFYDSALAHASYLVGCQKMGDAIVIDPGRDIEPYLQVARQEGLRIAAAAETHIHADFVSGARELAERVDARLLLSDAGPSEWKYLYADNYQHQLLNDGDSFYIGGLKFDVLHTPGHTPESLSFVLTDQGGGADRPMGIFTGDFVFVGAIGRPDLLEEAAGIAGTAEPGARDLFRSIGRFRQLPDFLQVWPAHGAGSACGKGLGAVPSSTVGYEKLFNPALQYHNEQEFVDYILAEQPEPPKYFALMKRVNKEGPKVLGETRLPSQLEVGKLAEVVASEQVVDTSTAQKFANGHVPGTINLPVKFLAMWGGSLIDYQKPVYLISSEHDLPEIIRILQKIGIENFGGYFDAEGVADAGLNKAAIRQQSPAEIAQLLNEENVELIDVRGMSERQHESIPGSSYLFLGEMKSGNQRWSPDRTYVFQCRSGARSMIAASIADSVGANVINLAGGLEAWKKAGLPVAVGSAETVAAGD